MASVCASYAVRLRESGGLRLVGILILGAEVYSFMMGLEVTRIFAGFCQLHS